LAVFEKLFIHTGQYRKGMILSIGLEQQYFSK